MTINKFNIPIRKKGSSEFRTATGEKILKFANSLICDIEKKMTRRLEI